MAAAFKPEKIVLGTVQFGLNYGISNSKGQVTREEIYEILSYAHVNGVTTLDTAAAYGNSEEAIGFALRETKLPFNIISKLPPVSSATEVRRQVEASLTKLGIEKLHAYLLHNFSIYQHIPKVMEELLQLQHEGLIGSIGFSLYHPFEAQELLAKEIPIDVVQFPYNVFDQRFTKVLDELKQQQIETHVRSVFLQGLFFLNPTALPAYFSSVKSKIVALQQLAQQEGIPLHALLLHFVLAHPSIDKLVIGVESLDSLRKNLSIGQYSGQITHLITKLPNYKEEDESILLPYNWKTI